MFTRKYLCIALPLLLICCQILVNAAKPAADAATQPSGKLEKMIVDNGVVTLNLEASRLTGPKAELRFTAASDSFFSFIAFNNELRAAELGLIPLNAQNPSALPAALKGVQLAIEKRPSEEAFQLVVRDAKTGFVFFNIEGQGYAYDANRHVVGISGRLLFSADFARKLGRQADAGSVAGGISATTTVIPVEIQKIENGNVVSAVMPARPAEPSAGTVPGPDVIVGDLPSMVQSGSSGTQVGLAIATTSCNAGVVDLNWFALPSTDHPVIPQNLYRLSGGASNTDRFEQIGQGWMKHAFTALTENVCSLGCNGTGGTHLGSGCSDPYDTSLNGSQTGIGSRAWANPFTGVFPGGNDANGQPTSRDHVGHSHTGTSHRLLVEQADLNTSLNPGATYYAEAQYVTPHEYAWCQTHAGQCNMYNNVSYRRYNVTGTTSFSFSAVGVTVRSKPAIAAWTGSSGNVFEPAPGNDGIGYVVYKVTNPSANVWHYEYAVYNENLDRAIQSFSVPLGCGITVSNLGFHAPLQPAAAAFDGTQNSAGYSNTAWTSAQTATSLAWNSETFAQNQNANAIRWGTMYNFRFDSNKPPQAANCTLGFFKTGSPITVSIQAPTPDTPNALQMTGTVSRLTQGAMTFDLDPLMECRSGGAGGNYTLVVTYNNNLAAGSASVTNGTGSVSGVTRTANTMTVSLTGLTDVDQLDVTLSGVQDTCGQSLPDSVVTMKVLVGDTNGDGTVNSGDIGQTKSQSGADLDATNLREDVNADGVINSADIGLVKGKSGAGF